MTTHNPTDVLWFCHRAVILQEGRTIAEGPTAAVVTRELLHRLYGPRRDIFLAEGVPVVVPLGTDDPAPWIPDTQP
ncbi:MAG: hypothetical protein JW820_20110 [Spirochaetales bacterium]|nr:hypothetical protein [Spirochaetales bacterium]